MTDLQRCPWAEDADDLMKKYHDEEWGVVVRDDKTIFEFLILESFQAGLSWKTILNKRQHFKKVFADFDPVTVSKFSKKEASLLLQDKGIIRNRAKIEAAINNAKVFLDTQKEFGTFSTYMWNFAPASNLQAIAWAKDLKVRGFKFLGPTTIYAHMQATGMVNDHTNNCFRKKEVSLNRRDNPL